MKYIVLLTLVFSLIFFLTGQSLARTGRLKGRVVDTSGKPIPGALATLSDGKSSAATDTAGRFIFRELPAGEYRLYVSRQCYVPLTVSNIRIHDDATTSLGVGLKESTDGRDCFGKPYRMPIFTPDSSIHIK